MSCPQDGPADPSRVRWERVFPGVPDLDALLTDIDRTADREQSSAGPAGTAARTTSPEHPRAEQRRFAYASAWPDSDRVLFGAIMSRHVVDLFEAAGRTLELNTCLAIPARVHDDLVQTVLRDAAEQGLRPVLQFLGRLRRQQRLRGDDPYERFADFERFVATPAGYREFQDAYPELLPRVRRLVRARLDAVLHLLDRTRAHWRDIITELDLLDDDRVAVVELGHGDAHAAGQVAVLQLSSGRRVVAKPRDISLEAGYGEFSAWLGSQIGEDLRQLRSHSTPTLGWFEHAEPTHGPLHPRFFAQVGVHLAALFLLNGTDIHYENIVTDQLGRPVVVDAEALFTPYLPGAGRLESDLLGVVATGLLRAGPEAGFEYGALEYRSGAAAPLRSWRIRNAGRDDMHLSMAEGKVDHPGVLRRGHRPGADDARDLIDAFTSALSWVLRHRSQVANRIESTFTGPCRYIHRPTMSYAMVARMCTHPMFAAERDRRRAAGRVAVLAPITPWPMIADEINALVDGDIPAFTVDIRRTQVCDAVGREVPGVHMRETPLSRVLRGLEGLGPEDLDEQAAVVHDLVAGWGAPAAVPPS